MLPGERGAAVVTGASSGIGAATARELVKIGFTVFGTVRRTEDKAALEARGVRAVTLDVTQQDTIEAAERALRQAVGARGLRALVNNAGAPAGGPLELLPLAQFRAVLEVNLVGVLAVTQAFLPLLKTGRGRIVNISSVAGRAALPFMGPYSASKHGLEALSDSLRRELVPYGIGVTVLEPGAIQSRIWDKVRWIDTAPYRDSVYEPVLVHFLERMLRGARRSPEATIVGHAVARALTARRPPIRMLVSGHPFLDWLALRLPDRVVDWMLEKALWKGRAVPGGNKR